MDTVITGEVAMMNQHPIQESIKFSYRNQDMLQF
jgi:hypothetical protein